VQALTCSKSAITTVMSRERTGDSHGEAGAKGSLVLAGEPAALRQGHHTRAIIVWVSMRRSSQDRVSRDIPE
jgi:hypothetical protein